jgi:hypothetical protein
MICPICQKRKAKRDCPAKAQNICAICCGTEREVTIDCPSDCGYLIASRQHHIERRDVDWEEIPFRDTEISPRVVEAHQDLLWRLSYAIGLFARDNPATIDSDVQVALQALAETYKTLASGIVYEKSLDHRLQRELYDALKLTVTEYKKGDAAQVMVAPTSPLDGDVRDALIYFTQLAAIRSNGRPKGRAFIDSLRSQFKPAAFAKESPPLILAR